ncbi:hypothetical protein BGY98DRAFT_939927 [Russula aff. rugulosa BPL654]|nr:hypothetical protein BGY98DRAFT_939927 [Russula aff. rugulosa BPL654]
MGASAPIASASARRQYIIEEGACCHITDKQTCHACNRTSKLADDRMLGQENECGHVHHHNAGEGEGGKGRRQEDTGGITQEPVVKISAAHAISCAAGPRRRPIQTGSRSPRHTHEGPAYSPAKKVDKPSPGTTVYTQIQTTDIRNCSDA